MSSSRFISKSAAAVLAVVLVVVSCLAFYTLRPGERVAPPPSSGTSPAGNVSGGSEASGGGVNESAGSSPQTGGSGNAGNTPPSPPPEAPEVGFELRVEDGVLVGEAWGYVGSLGFYSLAHVESPVDYPELVVFPSESYSEEVPYVHADRVYVNSSYLWFEVNMSKITEKLSPGDYRVVAWSGGRKVALYNASVSEEGIVLRGSEGFEAPSVLECRAQADNLYEAVICSYTSETLAAVGRAVFGNLSISSVADAAWRALEWVEGNLAYDSLRASSASTDYRDPLTTIRLKGGVCRDYAVLLAAALLAGGAQDAYIVTLDVGGFGHAFAAVNISGILYVLDQKLPVMSLSDYVEYLLGTGGDFTASIYRVSMEDGSPAIYAFLDTRLMPVDDYPDDKVPVDVVEDAVYMAGWKTGVEPSPLLGDLLPLGVKVYVEVPRLEEISSGPVRLGYMPSLYSPVFREGWTRLLAREIGDVLAEKYSDVAGSGGSFWASIPEDMGVYGVLYVYASPTPALRSALTGNITEEMMLEAWPVYGCNESSFTVNVYLVSGDSISGPVAAISQPGYVYFTVPFVQADEWVVKGGMLRIRFNASRLLEISGGWERIQREAQGKGSAGLLVVVFRNGDPVAAKMFAKIVLQAAQG